MPVEAQAAPAITQLKKLYPETVLVRDGRAEALIVVPEEKELEPAAKRLQQAVRRQSGAVLPMKRATSLVDENWRIAFTGLGQATLVALGNVNNNRLLLVLFGERYEVADSVYPGKGGYVIRTIHDPFANGINVLALAGSDTEGVEKAVTVFSEKFIRGSGKDFVLKEPVVEVEFERKAYPFLPPPADSLGSKRQPQYSGVNWFREQWKQAGFMEASGKVVESQNRATTLVAVTGLLARMGQTYFRTGNKELPPLMKELVDKNRRFLKNPARLEEMGARSAQHVHEWDLLEELPIWTDQDRLDVTNALLMDAALGHERRAFHQQAKEGTAQCLDENHGTFSALNSFDAWRYFDKYYRLPESDYWMACADAVFSGQASTFQILEDAAGYLCYCPTHAMEYALKRRDLTYFQRGIALNHARYVSLVCMNNLGLSTGFGDASGIVYPEFFELLTPAAWYCRDPKLYWVVRNALPQACGLRFFQKSLALDLTVEPEEPTEWTGLVRIPLYEAPLAKGDSAKTPVFAPKKDVDERRFNKVVFKENWSPDGQYLLLDGAGDWAGPPGPHGHKHDDINTLINFTALGRMWLVDHTYPLRAFQDHSGVYVTCNGQGGYRKRTLAELKHFFQSQDYGLTQSSFANWERSLFWKKGSYFLVVDRALADKEGEYFARCSLRALGSAELRGKDLCLAQKDRYCKILSDGGANVDVEYYTYTDDQWKTFYAYADPVVRVFQQDKRRDLKQGESLGFVNLLYAYPSKDREVRVTLKPASEKCALLFENGAPSLMGVGEMPDGLGIADMFVLNAEVSLALGATALAGGLVQTDIPCDLALDSKQKELRLQTRQRATVRLAGSVKEVTDNGKPLTPQTEKDAAFLLEPGEHAIRFPEWNGLERSASVAAKAIAAAESAAAKRAAAMRAAAVQREVRGVEVEVVRLDGSLNALLVADVDGGEEEWVVGGGTGVAAYKPNGRKLWSFATTRQVRAVDAGDVDGDGALEIAAGCDDEHVYLLDGAGSKRWSFACKPSTDSISGQPAVDYVRIADLEGDGKQEIVAGANWVHVLDAGGQVKWERYMDLRRGQLCGDFVCGTVDDLNHDGKKEIIALFTASYPLLQVFDSSGRILTPSDVSPDSHEGINTDVPIQVAALDLFGGGKTKEIVCTTASQLSFFWPDHRKGEEGGGKVGGPMAAMSWFQPDPKLPPALFAATTMCGIMAVKPDPKRNDRWINASVKWHRSLDEKVTALLAADTNSDGKAEVFAGTKKGNVYLFNVEDGRSRGHARVFGASVTCLVLDARNRLMLAGQSDGTVMRLRIGGQ